jgi:hypothetical protein
MGAIRTVGMLPGSAVLFQSQLVARHGQAYLAGFVSVAGESGRTWLKETCSV